MTTGRTVLALLVLLVVLPAPALGEVPIVVNNVDPPGSGFNDPTPVAPVGGNPGVTLGEQRLLVFARAAALWGAELTGPVEIVVQATFTPLACDATTAVLGASSAIQIFSDFPGAPYADTWYAVALANKLAGYDLTPGPPDPGFLAAPHNDDLYVLLNGAIDGNEACLAGTNWYYGFDHAAGRDMDLLNVVMHEIAHGLGFANYVDDATGSSPHGKPDVYTRFTLDMTTGLHWSDMLASERGVSATNTGNVVWDGPEVTARLGEFLGPRPVLLVIAPETIAGDYEVQTASFGPALTLEGVSGDVVEVEDGTGVATDACEPIAGDLTGGIALVDRGTCTFTTKVLHAQDAGAVGVLVVNNLETGLAPMGGADPAVAIPSVGISMADGERIRSELPGVAARLALDPARLAGAHDAGYIRLYAPDPVEPGSSISHWDTVAMPNLLMEPFINDDLRASDGVDLTRYQLLDVGWDACLSSDTSPTVVIDGCDSGVANVTFDNGCTLADTILECADNAATHELFVACVSHVVHDLVDAGFFEVPDKNAIVKCACTAD